MNAHSGLPAGRPIAWDDRVRAVSGASILLGGAPWGVLRIAPAGQNFVRRLRAAGPAGLVPAPGVEYALADLLVGRGIAHPLAMPGLAGAVDVVVPAYEHPESLDECLRSLRAGAPALRIIVVDDASRTDAVAEVARRYGAILLQHNVNRGPAAARNTGLREVTAPIVAFVDSDCAVTPGWLRLLAPHFDDPRVAAVAPRISPRTDAGSAGWLARYEVARSALDMGARPELVTHGAPLGFLPSAALLVRREDLTDGPFDERLRVGEDVDLVWRLVDAGRQVRYQPAAVVTHAMRARPTAWAGRIFDYGTSAAELDRRHPGRLAPARLSVWNVAAAAALLGGRPGAAVGAVGVAAALLARTLRAASVDVRVAPLIVGKGLVSDGEATGHLLRREWWPIGWLALAAAPRCRVTRAAAALMLAAPIRDWLSERPRLNPVGYLALRLIDDAAYGSGVIVSAVRARRAAVLVPVVRLPRTGRR